jgi:predicted AAA+ superfamily ATPase
MENPFNITKANDYSDLDIASYWVDFFGDSKRIKPNSPMPILIKGSKGSGKTHLLKYFSYELQKIKSGNNLDNILNQDKYIGIFYRCSGLNSDRFKGKGISDEDWTLIFSYYLELWFAQKLIK